jgi:diguanylate cyclase (GGDEF)-like protein
VGDPADSLLHGPDAAAEGLAAVFTLVFGMEPGDRSANDQLIELVIAIAQIREYVNSLSRGDLQASLELRGPLAGALKAMTANLRHLAWQANEIAAGDFGQRVDYLGDFSMAFNAMAENLETAISALRTRERELSSANVALQAAQEQLVEQATHDPLTGLLNRRALQEIWHAESSRADRAGGAITIAVVDLDSFKTINDQFGHDAGDAVLVGVASVSSRLLRASDRVFRMGGDEFLILMPDTPVTEALGICDRVRAAFAELDLGPAPRSPECPA